MRDSSANTKSRVYLRDELAGVRCEKEEWGAVVVVVVDG